MKKFLAIAAIAATFTACNDDKKTEEVKVDSPVVVAPVVVDSPKVEVKMDSGAKMEVKADTSKMKMEVKKP